MNSFSRFYLTSRSIWLIKFPKENYIDTKTCSKVALAERNSLALQYPCSVATCVKHSKQIFKSGIFRAYDCYLPFL